MAIDVMWEEFLPWSGDPQEALGTHVLATLADDHSLVERFLVDFRTADLPYLHFISHETVTIFHQQHIPQLVEELEILCQQDHDPDVESHLRAVLDFVRSAYGAKDTLIAFRVK
jgi:hypothetical protein